MRETKDFLSLLMFFAFAAVIFVLAVWGLSAAGYMALPWFYNQQTKAIHASNQYVITEQARISDLYNSYLALQTRIDQSKNNPALLQDLEAQRRAIAMQIRAAASAIPPQYVPPYALYFINQGNF